MLTLLILVSFASATQESDAWFYKGHALSDLNKFDEAIKAYDKVIENNPQNSITWDNKGIALVKLNKFAEAITAFDKAIELNPKDWIALEGKKTLSGRIK